MTTPRPLIDALDHRVLDEAEAADFRRQFPGVLLWFGAATRHWWAMVRLGGRWRLIEAARPYALRSALARLVSLEAPSAPGRHAREDGQAPKTAST